MKRFSLAKHPWNEPSDFKVAGVSEAGKAWAALVLAAVVLITLVVAFVYSSAHTIVPIPPR